MRFVLSIALVIFSVLGLNAQDSLRLTFNLDGFKDTDKLDISFSEGRFNLPTDNPKLTITRKLNGPEVMYIQYKDNIQSFWIENNDIEVYIPKSGFRRGLVVKGSTSQALWNRILVVDQSEKAQILEENIDSKVAHSFLASKSNLLLHEDAARLLSAAPDSIQNLAKYNISLLGIDKTSRLKEDDQMMDFIANTVNGEQINTINLRGDYLLLDFAATSCSWCWVAYPTMVDIVSEYDNLSVLTFNEDYNYEIWAKKAEQREINLPWPVLWEADNKKEIFIKYGINVLPTFLLISPEGKILERWQGGKDEKIERMLEKHGVE